MLAYVARRLLFAVATVLAAILISLLLVHASDGSPGAIVLGHHRHARADRREERRTGLGPADLDPVLQLRLGPGSG